MKTRYIESIPCQGLQNATHLDVEVYYSKGGMNCFSGGMIKRGFYLSVTPVTRKGDGMVSFTAFSGIAQLLFETQRYTDKQYDKAIEMSQSVKADLISHVLAKGGSADAA